MDTKEAKEFINKTDIGLAVIDWMREKVKRRVAMFLSFVADQVYDKWQKTKREAFSSAGCPYVWEIVNHENCIEIRCYLPARDSAICPNVVFSLAAYPFDWKPRGHGSIEISHVKSVYESLPILVQGLMEIFPELLAKRSQPLLDAYDWLQKQKGPSSLMTLLDAEEEMEEELKNKQEPSPTKET